MRTPRWSEICSSIGEIARAVPLEEVGSGLTARWCFFAIRMVDANIIQMSRQEYGEYGSDAMIQVRFYLVSLDG
jgi:hypothetical protein